MSMPCKGFSGHALGNPLASAQVPGADALALRGLADLEAWADDPPEFILFENVPGSRPGARLLEQVIGLLEGYG